MIRKKMEGPEILKSEVRAAMAKMQRNKSAGPDEIVIELVTALEDFKIEKVTEVFFLLYKPCSQTLDESFQLY